MRRFTFVRKNMILFFLLVCLLVMKFFSSNTSTASRVDDYLYIRSSFFYSSGIPDSLPHRVYRNKEDSIRWRFYNENKGYVDGFTLLNLGAIKRETNNHDNYFFSLHGYKFKDHNSIYFRKDGKKYFIKNNTLVPTSLELIQDPKDQVLTLLLPVSHEFYQIITAILYITGFIILVYFLYIIFLPLGILFKISRGQPFHYENISSLFKIGKLLIFFGIVFFIIQLVSHMFMANIIPELISFSYFQSFMESWGILTTGIIALIIAGAFEKGAQLQEEQELTV